MILKLILSKKYYLLRKNKTDSMWNKNYLSYID